jgi:hypothetical protein
MLSTCLDWLRTRLAAWCHDKLECQLFARRSSVIYRTFRKQLPCGSRQCFTAACKNNDRVNQFRTDSNERFVSGHDFSRAAQASNDDGFSPCGAISFSVRPRPAFGSSTRRQDIPCAAFTKWAAERCPARKQGSPFPTALHGGPTQSRFRYPCQAAWGRAASSPETSSAHRRG